MGRLGGRSAQAGLALLVALGAAGCARPQGEAPTLTSRPGVGMMGDEAMAARLVFDAADADGDGQISEAELVQDTAAAFAAQDGDHDGLVAAGELDPHDKAAFDLVDGTKDGRLTFGEVMERKLVVFRAADKDGSGTLSFEEFVAFEREGGGSVRP